jgi:uncharacterized protein YjbI with pentapeptide repeats
MSKFTERFTQLSKRARVLLAVVAALVVVVIVGGALLAGNPSLLTRLSGRLAGMTINGCVIKPRTSCERTDLSGANLAGANLFNARLTDVNLTGANLADANLSLGILLKANLTKANLTGAILEGAYLAEPRLTDANLTDANLTDADLSAATLRKANLTKANLTRADLEYADLEYANLTGANLTGANLRGAVMFHTTWPDGTLAYANTGWIPSAPPPGTLEQAYQLRPRHVANQCLSGTTLWYTMLWECDTDNNRRWKFEPAGNFYTVKIQTSQWCLTVENASKDAGATVVAGACQDTDNQLWHLDATGDGGYRLINRNSGLCAAPRDGGTTNDTVTVQYPCTSDAARLWGLHGQ